MLEKIVGQTTIRSGLTRYLNRYQFKNAVTDDLWACIADAWANRRYNFTVKELMDGWTLQMGYPMVVFDQQNDTNIYTIRQEKYFKAMSVSICH